MGDRYFVVRSPDIGVRAIFRIYAKTTVVLVRAVCLHDLMKMRVPPVHAKRRLCLAFSEPLKRLTPVGEVTTAATSTCDLARRFILSSGSGQH